MPTPYDFGAVGNGVADDTTALQAWINATQGSGPRGFGAAASLPPGWYKTGPLTVTRPLSIIGSGEHQSVLDLISGSNGPLLTLSTAYDSSNYASSYGDAVISLADLTLTGTKTDPTGITNGCDGIRLVDAPSNFLRPQVKLQNVNITGMPRSALRGYTFTGAVEAVACRFYNCREYLLDVNTANDWQFSNCLFGDADKDNVLLSGVGQFIFDSCNFYTADYNNVQMYSNSGSGMVRFTNCSFDRAKQHGILYNYAGGGNVVLEGCYFNRNSDSTANGYSDIYVGTTVSDGLVLNGCWFEKTYIQDASKKTKYNIEFQGTGSTVQVVGGTKFANGGTRIPGTTNAPAQIRGYETPYDASGTNQAGGDLYLNAGQGTGTGNGGIFRLRSARAGSTGSAVNALLDIATIDPASGLKLSATEQYSGFVLYAADGTTPVALIKGGATGNKAGVLQLVGTDGTTVTAQLAATGSGFQTMLIPPSYASDTAAGTGGLTTGMIYWNTTNSAWARKT